MLLHPHQEGSSGRACPWPPPLHMALPHPRPYATLSRAAGEACPGAGRVAAALRMAVRPHRDLSSVSLGGPPRSELGEGPASPLLPLGLHLCLWLFMKSLRMPTMSSTPSGGSWPKTRVPERLVWLHAVWPARAHTGPAGCWWEEKTRARLPQSMPGTTVPCSPVGLCRERTSHEHAPAPSKMTPCYPGCARSQAPADKRHPPHQARHLAPGWLSGSTGTG